MRTSFVLVKGLNSNSDKLIFKNFGLSKICPNDNSTFREAQRLFSKMLPSWGDWIYQRQYKDSKNAERIAFDIEDTLLLLRLYKAGDIFFLQPCIEQSNGNLSCQRTYPVMVSTTSTIKYKIDFEECRNFDKFASELVLKKNWSSNWFKIARRFFLYGGGKEFNTAHDQLDRVVDYITALEAILVPESDFVGRRLRERAVKLLDNMEFISQKRLLRDFYDIRSTIVHGDKISTKQMSFLKNIDHFETVVRRVIVSALNNIPSNNDERKQFLDKLFYICDQTRAEQIFNQFCKIEDAFEKEKCFKRISNRIQ